MVTDCVLGLSAESFSDKPTPVMDNVKDLFNPHWTFLILFALIQAFPSLGHLIKLRFVPRHVEHFFTKLMATAVKSRKTQLATGHIQRADFLEYLLQLGEKRNLNTRHLLAHTMIFLLDGFETVAGVLSHMLLLLGRDEVVQQRLREEILAHLQDGRVPFEKLNDLPYLDACLNGKKNYDWNYKKGLQIRYLFDPQNLFAYSLPALCPPNSAPNPWSYPTRMVPISKWKREPFS